ncbi:MAG TPA: SPFH domain-containing protein [Actinophytocola sp.]|uniref:SPFH domain-containing protein n=1 Tax=Actinophytocola sp. TaxID=1872138 RepID=UPI002DDD8152|nr:SPFH domain-containing protein [Actinophytocola sp.]HEV2780387.1 SPFH domain-containing protein [Actinophytocola sp.]
MFIAFLITFLAAAIAAAVWMVAKHPSAHRGSGSRYYEPVDVKRGAGFVAVIAGGVAGLLLLLSSMTVVPANQVGVVTHFGAWAGTVDSGLRWVAPWSSVDTFSTRNNKSIRDAADGNGNCVTVKLRGNASACIDLTVLYTIDRDNAEILWRGWGSFERLNSDLVDRSTDDAVNMVFSAYAAEELPTNRAKITDTVTRELDRRLRPQGVRLESITLGDNHLPKEVQDRINSILEADAKTQVAKKAEEAAAAEARANAARQQSLTPEALIKACLDAARDIKPTFFDCGLGGATNRPGLILGGQR